MAAGRIKTGSSSSDEITITSVATVTGRRDDARFARGFLERLFEAEGDRDRLRELPERMAGMVQR